MILRTSVQNLIVSSPLYSLECFKNAVAEYIVESTRIRYMKNGRKKIQFKGINLGGMGTIVGNVALDSKYEDTKVTVIKGGK